MRRKSSDAQHRESVWPNVRTLPRHQYPAPARAWWSVPTMSVHCMICGSNKHIAPPAVALAVYAIFGHRPFKRTGIARHNRAGARKERPNSTKCRKGQAAPRSSRCRSNRQMSHQRRVPTRFTHPRQTRPRKDVTRILPTATRAAPLSCTQLLTPARAA